MMPENELDTKAEEWFNAMLPKLRYKQDYTVCGGHSKDMIKDGKQVGITIHRPYIRLFSTGITKLYQMAVLGEKFKDVKYTKAQEQELDKDFEAAEAKHQMLMEAENAKPSN